jgi:hypothetical protein|tara:strand:- start:1051 stop:1365 length:315 start_codon:yes stop_codon:yes gene_type:complete
MADNDKTKQQQWHENEANKMKQGLGLGEEGKIYPPETDPASLRQKYSHKNPYGENVFTEDDFKVKDPSEEVKEEEYIRIKKSWLENLRDFDTWTKWKNGLIEYK